ncbi:MAG: ATP-dependent RNA helicase HrpA [Phycisphaerae bacterium]|nr:ATP-dependent RNA helicase HrpA [Phycisphaerae bacterium]
MLRRVGGIERAASSGRDMSRATEAIRRELTKLENDRESRRERPFDIEYPAELPVSGAREEIARAIREHQVVVVCGETGSGKTTQIPKICLDLGRGVDGLIGHTQPRRVAARTVATRIADELGTTLGEGVGYSVRFNDRTTPQTRVKLMTDGILLAETARDRDLLAYDTIIIDEAHERSLNIDFLLGYLKRLLPRRRDLRLIVTSATIDPDRFSRHFGDAPVVRVSGRTHPVEIRYRPPAGEDADDALVRGIVDAVGEIDAAGLEVPDPSGLPDILVFLPGEREIREASEALAKAELPDTEVVPLFARLSVDKQDRVFSPGSARRIVLATNVAETSLTVPRIRGVVDTGLARIARYSPRRRVQRLPVEPIARASADQRSGRCGRIAPGVCIRLFAEDDLRGRDEFTPPEILRSSLASVILRMTDLGLGDPETFPFVEKPSGRLIRDGYETLYELGAVDRRREPTALGRDLARLPIDPRIGRMVLAGIDEECLPELLVIASVLTASDPRERQGDRAGSIADAMFKDPSSDFLSFLRIWKAWTDARETRGSSALRTWTRRHGLSLVRMREWQDLHDQLRHLAGDLLARRSSQGRKGRGRPVVGPVREDPPGGAIHRAILAGLVSNIGRRGERGEYRGLMGGTFEIFPGSVLRRQDAPWIVAAEIVETSRRWARTCARIRGDWIERVAPHLVRKSHFEPHFVPETGFVSAWERVTCGDLDAVERRRVPYAPIDAAAAREVFIQQALVAEGLKTDAPWMDENRRLREGLARLSDRERDVVPVDEDDRLHRFYDSRLPEGIHNVPAFEAWRRKAERRDPSILRMKESDLTDQDRERPDAAAYPDRIAIGGVDVGLAYRHEPGDDRDGVTATIPLELLGRFEPASFEWLVPGLLIDKLDALARSLPRRMRTRIMPILETATGAAEHLPFGEGSLIRAYAGYLSMVGGAEIRPEDFRLELLEPHHLMRFELVDEEGRILACTRRYEELLASHRDRAREAFEESVEVSVEDDTASRFAAIRDRTSWDFETLPEDVILRRGTATIIAYPAISDEGDHVRVRVTDDRTTALERQRRGVLRLLALQVGDAIRHHLDHLPDLERLRLAASSLESGPAFTRGLSDLAIAVAVRGADLAMVRDEEAFVDLDDVVRRDLWPSLERACDLVEPILQTRQSLLMDLESPGPASWADVRRDEQRHLERLVPPGFAGSTPPERLEHLPRYLEGARRRLDRLRGAGLERDRDRREEFEGWRRLHEARCRDLDRLGRIDPGIEAFGWLLEEYRIQLFAQELGTAVKVSPAILKDRWRRLDA